MSKDISATDYMRTEGLRKIFYVNSRYHRGRRGSEHETPEIKLMKAAKSFLLKEGKILRPEVTRAIEEADENFLAAFLSHAEDAGINLYDMPIWKESVNTLAESLLDETTSAHEIWNGYREYSISAAGMVDSFGWDKLFSRTWEIQKGHNYVRDTFRNIMKNYANNFSEAFKELAEDEVFFAKQKPAYAARGSIYSQYIECGFLTSKTARKIRSDASSDASAAGLRTLFDNKEKYANYDDLLLQFTDSKYDDVICLLADNLPEYLITSIMGTDSYHGKRRVERRLEQIEADKEAAKQNEDRWEDKLEYDNV